MRRAFFAALLAATATVGLSGGAQAQGRQDFAVANRSGYQINEIYVSPARVSEWGRDLLGSNVLPNGRRFNVTFPPNVSDCAFDIKVVFSDGDTGEARRVDLCSVSVVNVFWQGNAARFTTE